MKRAREEFYSDSGSEPEEAGVKSTSDGRQQRALQAGLEKWRNRGEEEEEDDFPSNSDASDSEASSDDDSAEEGSAGQEIPIGQLIALKQDGSTAGPTSKARNRAVKAAAKGSFKREHKHRPVEMSSKRPVSVLRETLQTGRHHGRDPRFDALTAKGVGTGKVDDLARKRYSFLYDEKLPQEKREIQEAMKKTKSDAKKAELKEQLTRLSQQSQSEGARRRKDAASEQERAKRREARESGKTPYYLKKSEKKKQEMLAKYEELKASGKLERFMEKRRKKNAAKDHRYLPTRRPDAE